jgi:hypothetical protein
MPRATALPVEILETIFSHLKTHELVKCQRVCKPWKKIVTTCDSLWPTEVIVTGEGSYYCCVNGLRCDTEDETRKVCNAISKLGRKTTSLVVDLPFPPPRMVFSMFRCFWPLKHINIDVDKLLYENLGFLLLAVTVSV